LRNPDQRARAREFGRANLEAITDYMTQRAAATGERFSIPIEDVAGVFAVASDGFAQAALFDPDASRLFGVLIDLVMRGLRSYEGDADDLKSTS
jgi:hypothetical protein